MSNWGKLPAEEDKEFNEWYDKYVPACGKCDTLAGEIIRAINRLVYRWYNDGDTVDRYGGNVYNHNRACDTFLCKNVVGYVTLSGVSEFDFEDAVCKRLKFIYEYLKNHTELFETPNIEDCLDDAPYEPWEEDEWEEDEWDEEDEWEDEDFDEDEER